MKKNLMLCLSSAILLCIGCGKNSGTEITKSEVYKFAEQNEKLETDILMNSTNVSIKVNKPEGKPLFNGKGYIDFVKRGVGKMRFTVTGGVLDIAAQDIINVDIPNTTFSDVIGKTGKGETFTKFNTYVNLPVTKQIAQLFVGDVQGILEDMGMTGTDLPTEWKAVTAKYYKIENKDKNTVLNFTLECNDIQAFYKEYEFARETLGDKLDALKVLGEGGKFKITLTCDEYGYISNLHFELNGDNLIYNGYNEDEEVEETLPEASFYDFMSSIQNVEGGYLQGAFNLNFDINMTRTKADSHLVNFRRVAYEKKVDEKTQEASYTKKDDAVIKFGDDGKSSDDILEVVTTNPIKVYESLNPLAKNKGETEEDARKVYTRPNQIFNGYEYCVKMSVKDNKYKFMDEERWDEEEYANYANVCCNGIIVPIVKPKEGDLTDYNYCYFTRETEKVENEEKTYIVLHIGSSVYNSYLKAFGSEPEFEVNVDLVKVE